MSQERFDFGSSDAVFSKCGLYRYELMRSWSTAKPMMWIMLNPSTADAVDDDPTIRRCIRFAQRQRAGGIIVCNLFALRSTDPSALKVAKDPVGPDNDTTLINCARRSGAIVCAWGTHGTLNNRNQAVMRLLDNEGLSLKMFCLGLTKHGHPRHPLYLKKNTELLPLIFNTEDI